MTNQKKIEKSLKYSILDGSFWAVMFGFGETYLAAFAVFLRASDVQIGLLTSLPLLLGSLSQFFSMKLIKLFNSRKKFVVVTALIQALMWIPIIFVFYLHNWSVYFLILFVIIYLVSGMISAPAWNSWISDLVNPNERGKYFGNRSRIIGLITLISVSLGGIILDVLKDGITKQYLGFAALFSAAMVARLISVLFLNKKYDPGLYVREKDKFTFKSFLKQIRYRNFGMLVLFLAFMNFSVYIAGPFFVAYWLYDLNLSYIAYMIIIVSAFVAKYISLPIWGSFIDIYGTKKIMALNGFVMPIVPILWLFSTNIYYMIFIQLLAGISWAGFELSSFNFIFDTTTPEKRPRCISYYNVINGIMIFLGTTIGSLIVKYNNLFWTKYYLVFLISGILRYVISFTFLPKLKEVRKVYDISYNKIFFKLVHTIMIERFHVGFLMTYPRKLRLLYKPKT
ncbi:MFS transporter [Candidatus Woesearchaeota archaeon]|nr:MFS transporter [Candidatus Woesearchaeota archaeon]